VLLGLIYTTKPDTGTGVTLTRRGDTATVIDTTKIVSSANNSDSGPFVPSNGSGFQTSSPVASSGQSTATAPAGALPVGSGGSSYPAVTSADLSVLRAQNPMIPVSGVTADKLVDSFDDMRAGGGHRHEALDIVAARGTPVMSAAAGTILKLHNSVAGGLSIYVADTTQRFIMLYAHLDSYRPGIAAGMQVKKGELLGYVGFTGNASPAAPHLHFAVARSDNLKEWWKGTPLNPFLIWRGR
jgi:peptidoglycan LD-endopeptidase LytH